MISAIIAAAGAGRRMGSGRNKVFLPLAGQPILAVSCQALAACEPIGELVIAAAPGEVAEVHSLLTQYPPGKPWQVVAGGEERQYSIAKALAAVCAEAEYILVHDAARPLVQGDDICRVLEAAVQYEAAGLAVPMKDTVKQIDEEQFAVDTPPRQSLWAIQTPQAFAASLLRRAYNQADEEGFLGTDDASLVERLGVKVKLVQGSYSNIKITTPEDSMVAEVLYRKRQEEMRIGIGYDVHRFSAGRKLILGGVEIPYELGLEGHSDADVLLHAIKDALLGAAALGDIGRHFPDTDEQYRGASSLLLLQRVKEILGVKGYSVHNLDATIIAEKPRLASYIPQMNRTIADTLGIDTGQVNIKATTTEGLGFTGRCEGIAAQAVAAIKSM